jgi:hypothetical protein
MDGTREHHVSKISQTEKDKHHMFSLIYGIRSLKMNNKNVKQVLFGGGYQ